MKNKEYIFGTLFFIIQQWNKTGDALLLKKAGITTKQWMLLVLLVKEFTDHLPTLTEAAVRFGTSRQNLKQIALSLQKKGFLILSPDPSDNRIIRIALTGKHRKFFEGEQNLQWQNNFINNCFHGFNENELSVFKNFTEKLVQNIKSL